MISQVKNFTLRVAKNKNTPWIYIKYSGRDIYDAYRKAYNDYLYVIRPYKSKPSISKYCKNQYSRKQRREKLETVKKM